MDIKYSGWKWKIWSLNWFFLHIPALILKFRIFIKKNYMSYFPYNKQNVTWSSKNNGKDNKLEYNFLPVCRYLNVAKISEDNFTANRKFTSCYNIKILKRLWEKIYINFLELCMKENAFTHLKGKSLLSSI